MAGAQYVSVSFLSFSEGVRDHVMKGDMHKLWSPLFTMTSELPLASSHLHLPM